MDDQYQQDICRVCRSEGSADRPLFHPCICTGSIKFVHQECLTQWLRYSRKEYCELCSHRFSFTPIYSADMPSRLPVADVLSGLLASLMTAGRFWLHYTLVVFAWLCVVPLLACRIYRCMFADSVTSVFPLLKELISTENIVGDCLQGCLVVTCTVCTLLCLVWMREQILLGGGPEWLEPLPRVPARPAAPAVQPAAAARVEERAGGGEERAEGGEERSGGGEERAGGGEERAEGGEERADAAADSPAAAATAANTTAAAATAGAATATSNTTAATSNTTADVTTSIASAAATTATTTSTPAATTDITTTAATAAVTTTTTATAVAAADVTAAAATTTAAADGTTAAATTTTTADVTAAATPDVTTAAAAAAEVTPAPPTADAADADVADVDIAERADNNTLPAAAVDAGGDGEGAPPPAPLPEPAEAAPDPDENNWNPMDWDRGAEEVIWERLLGLDGSLIFLEHVLWVVSLNTLFILVFAFCPYHIGHYCVVAVRLHESVLSSHFEGLITTLVGYCVVGMALVLLHMAASRLTLVSVYVCRAQRLLGVCYVVVKVSMLAVVEIGLFPLICGWWLDICSLQLLGTTLQERQLSFQKAPGTCLFVHWLVGTVYVFYFASFVLLLREVLRPGALWFVLNLNDPDFNPIQDMIHLSVLSHTRRFLVSVLIFGSTVLVMLWLPVRLILRLAPGFLPYNISAFSDNPSIEPSFQILLLQVFMPALLEQGQAKACLKSVIRCWCVLASKITGLHSYLLGDSPANDEGRDDAAPAPPAGGADQARLPPPPLPFEPYERRSYMSVRLTALLLLAAVSLCLASGALLTVPVWLGRVLITHWLNMLPVDGELPAATSSAATATATAAAATTATAAAAASSSLLLSKSTIAWLVIDKESSEPHEIYTAACGLWVCWELVCHVRLVCDCARLAWTELWRRVAQWASLTARLALVSVTMFVLVPLLYGRLIDLIIMPLRVPLNQTPILFPLQNWALGLLYMKITFGLALMGPNWWLTNALDHFVVGGVRNLHVPTLLLDLVLPLVSVLGLALCVPYILVQSFVPLFVCESATLWLVQRAVYPAMAVVACLAVAVRYQCRQFRRLYEHIKNDKYLVGRRLVNYNPSLVEPKSGVSET